MFHILYLFPGCFGFLHSLCLLMNKMSWCVLWSWNERREDTLSWNESSLALWKQSGEGCNKQHHVQVGSHTTAQMDISAFSGLVVSLLEWYSSRIMGQLGFTESAILSGLVWGKGYDFSQYCCLKESKPREGFHILDQWGRQECFELQRSCERRELRISHTAPPVAFCLLCLGFSNCGRWTIPQLM